MSESFLIFKERTFEVKKYGKPRVWRWRGLIYHRTGFFNNYLVIARPKVSFTCLVNLATRWARAKQRLSGSEVPKLMVILSVELFFSVCGLFARILGKVLTALKNFFELTIRVDSCSNSERAMKQKYRYGNLQTLIMG